MSQKTYALRDIVMLINDAVDAFNKADRAYVETVEGAKSWNELMEGIKTVHTHHVRGKVRLSAAYDQLVKGAALEETKEKTEK